MVRVVVGYSGGRMMVAGGSESKNKTSTHAAAGKVVEGGVDWIWRLAF